MPKLHKSGIYAFINNSNGRIYIGSAINFSKRKYEHLRKLRKNKHVNQFFQNDFNKCKEEAFTFQILEEVENYNELLSIEQRYIDKYFDKQNCCYNITPTAGSMFGFKHSEKSKRKISKTLTGREIHPNTYARLINKETNPFAKPGKEHPKSGKTMPESAKEKIRDAMKSHKRTKEHCKNISIALTGRKIAAEQIMKMKDGRRKGEKNGRAKKIIQYDNNRNLLKIWDYMSLAAKETKTNLSTISGCCNGKNKTANGFIWRFYSE